MIILYPASLYLDMIISWAEAVVCLNQVVKVRSVSSAKSKSGSSALVICWSLPVKETPAPYLPTVQLGEFVRVPVLSLLEESLAAVPVFSSSFHQPTGPGANEDSSAISFGPRSRL